MSKTKKQNKTRILVILGIVLFLITSFNGNGNDKKEGFFGCSGPSLGIDDWQPLPEYIVPSFDGVCPITETSVRIHESGELYKVGFTEDEINPKQLGDIYLGRTDIPNLPSIFNLHPAHIYKIKLDNENTEYIQTRCMDSIQNWASEIQIIPSAKFARFVSLENLEDYVKTNHIFGKYNINSDGVGGYILIWY